MRTLRIFTSLLFTILPAAALLCAGLPPSPVGVWRTIDDNTHKPRGLIRLYEQSGVLFGKIEASFDPAEEKEVCDRCEGERRNKPVIGLIVLRNMKKSGANEYAGGDILDPDTGQIYKCRITVDGSGRRLVVRGYVGIALLGRSQVWFRQD
jgi:uncharacterized protein (DUF2147 family)